MNADNETREVTERAKAALEGTTPGPWEVNTEGWALISSDSDSVIHAYFEYAVCECGDEVDGSPHVAVSIEDAEFIAAARMLVSDLVAEIERLCEERIAEGAYLVKVHNERADLLRSQANCNQVLDDLIVRMESADRALSGDALTAARETTRSHLTSKSDGVRVALSYVREARNG